MSDTVYSYDRINFHKTFPPQASYISKILELAERNYSGTKEGISKETGIPTGKTSGKVVPNILYAQYMGLISYKLDKGVFSLRLTELGDRVFCEDKYLYEDITKLICHYNICDQKQGALLWSFLYFDISLLPNDVLQINTLKKKMQDRFQQNVDFDAVKKSYTDGFWSNCELMTFRDGLSFQERYFDESMKYMYAYSLLDSWDEYLGGVQEITVDQIINDMKWNKRFGLDNDEMILVLESLEDEGYLCLNKQLVPYTVIRTATKSDALLNFYSLIS